MNMTRNIAILARKANRLELWFVFIHVLGLDLIPYLQEYLLRFGKKSLHCISFHLKAVYEKEMNVSLSAPSNNRSSSAE